MTPSPSSTSASLQKQVEVWQIKSVKLLSAAVLLSHIKGKLC